MRLDIRKLELTHWAAIVMSIALVVFVFGALRTTSSEAGPTSGTTAPGGRESASTAGYSITAASWRTTESQPEAQPAPTLSPAEEAERQLLEKLGEDLQGIPIAMQKN